MRHPSKPRTARARRLAVEHLEDRTVPATFTVNGKALWTDPAGNTHPIPRAEVEVMAQVEASDATLIGIGTTDLGGNYSIRATDNVHIIDPDVYVIVRASSVVADIQSDPETPVTTYELPTSVVADVADGSTVTIPDFATPNNTPAGQAFSVLSALDVGARYASTLSATIPGTLDVLFPSTPTTESPGGPTDFSASPAGAPPSRIRLAASEAYH